MQTSSRKVQQNSDIRHHQCHRQTVSGHDGMHRLKATDFMAIVHQPCTCTCLSLLPDLSGFLQQVKYFIKCSRNPFGCTCSCRVTLGDTQISLQLTSHFIGGLGNMSRPLHLLCLLRPLRRRDRKSLTSKQVWQRSVKSGKLN